MLHIGCHGYQSGDDLRIYRHYWVRPLYWVDQPGTWVLSPCLHSYRLVSQQADKNMRRGKILGIYLFAQHADLAKESSQKVCFRQWSS